jgi:hypothetical protein
MPWLWRRRSVSKRAERASAKRSVGSRKMKWRAALRSLAPRWHSRLEGHSALRSTCATHTLTVTACNHSGPLRTPHEDTKRIDQGLNDHNSLSHLSLPRRRPRRACHWLRRPRRSRPWSRPSDAVPRHAPHRAPKGQARPSQGRARLVASAPVHLTGQGGSRRALLRVVYPPSRFPISYRGFYTSSYTNRQKEYENEDTYKDA